MATFLDLRTMQGDNTGTTLSATPLFLGSIGLIVNNATNIRVDLNATVGIDVTGLEVSDTLTVEIRRGSAANIATYAATTLVFGQVFDIPAALLSLFTSAYAVNAADFNPVPGDPGQLSYSLWVYTAGGLSNTIVTNGTQALTGVAAANG